MGWSSLFTNTIDKSSLGMIVSPHWCNMHWWTGGAGKDRLRGNCLSFDPWNLIQIMLAKGSQNLLITGFMSGSSPSAFYQLHNFLTAAKKSGWVFMFQASSVTKHFKDQIIFSRFDLAVPSEQFHVLIGPSGCGKSTFFDCLTGVFPLDDGTLFLNHEPVLSLGDHAAYMQQKDLLLPWFSLLDNALLPARVCGRDMQAAKDQALRLFQRLGIEGKESCFAGQVSGGMRQRCALVRTLMFNRPLILLDEPLSALDAISRRSLQSLLLRLQTEFKKTILMITHDIDEALLLADEITLLSPRPMSAARTFVLDLPKPRRFNDPVLMDIKAQVLERLEKDAGHDPD